MKYNFFKFVTYSGLCVLTLRRQPCQYKHYASFHSQVICKNQTYFKFVYKMRPVSSTKTHLFTKLTRCHYSKKYLIHTYTGGLLATFIPRRNAPQNSAMCLVMNLRRISWKHMHKSLLKTISNEFKNNAAC